MWMAQTASAAADRTDKNALFEKPNSRGAVFLVARVGKRLNRLEIAP